MSHLLGLDHPVLVGVVLPPVALQGVVLQQVVLQQVVPPLVALREVVLPEEVGLLAKSVVLQSTTLEEHIGWI